MLVGMPRTTTIKVPRELRDRLSALAHDQHTTLAGAITRTLDDADERAWWAAIGAENAALTAEQREGRISDATLADDLADPADDLLSETDGW
jgi:predicted transcriptional regulator